VTIEIRATAAREPSQEIGIAKRIVRYWLNGWFLTLQLGTGEHTLRGKPLLHGKNRNKISASAQQCAREIGSR